MSGASQCFPGGPVVKNLPCSVGDTGSIPGLGGSHVSWSSWAHVPQLLKPECPTAWAPQQEKPLIWEAHAPQLESDPCSLQLEKARVQWQRPSTANK